MNRKIFSRNQRGGFTLVEMLVVVFIIAVLAGLISAAAIRGLHRAKVAAIAVEINQLSMALDKYKMEFGEYPPDFSDITTDYGKSLILRHISRAFPRLVITGNTVTDKWNNLQAEIKSTTNPPVDIFTISLNPSTALRFWLGGMPDAQNKPIGFSKDPLHPFDTINTPTSRIGPFFEFDPGRLPLQPTSELGKYYPSGVIPGAGQPYIYFRAEQGQPEPKREYYAYDPSNTTQPYAFKSGSSSVAKPYWDQRNMGWVNPTSFQILCCGLDGKFGMENVYPTGNLQPFPITSASLPGVPSDVITDLNSNITITTANPSNFDHIDDQTNFSSGTIGDALP